MPFYQKKREPLPTQVGRVFSFRSAEPRSWQVRAIWLSISSRTLPRYRSVGRTPRPSKRPCGRRTTRAPRPAASIRASQATAAPVASQFRSLQVIRHPVVLRISEPEPAPFRIERVAKGHGRSAGGSEIQLNADAELPHGLHVEDAGCNPLRPAAENPQ